MKVRKATDQIIDCIVTNDRFGSVIVGYGDPALTRQALETVAAQIREIADEFGEPFTVRLTFGIDGITVHGETS